MEARAREDLELIRRLMDDSRRHVVDRGKHFIIWGLVPAVGLLATYAYVTTGAGPDPRATWSVLLVVGWAASLITGRRDARAARVSTLGRRLLSALWVSTGLTLTLIALAGLFGPLVDVRALSGLVAVVIAAPIAATSLLTGQRWLRAVSAGWWLGGAVMLFLPGPYTLPLLAAMSLVLMAVPGVVLLTRAAEGAAAGAA